MDSEGYEARECDGWRDGWRDVLEPFGCCKVQCRKTRPCNQLIAGVHQWVHVADLIGQVGSTGQTQGSNGISTKGDVAKINTIWLTLEIESTKAAGKWRVQVQNAS